MQVSLTQGEGITVKGINSYLFKKSKQHKIFFESHLEKSRILNSFLQSKHSKIVLDYCETDTVGEANYNKPSI